MQIELNDDQVSLLVDLLHRTHGDVEHTREEAEELIAQPGYATVGLLQLEFRLKELQKTIQEQSGHNWVHNDVTQRMEPRYKAREEMEE